MGLRKWKRRRAKQIGDLADHKTQERLLEVIAQANKRGPQDRPPENPQDAEARPWGR
jgi:hypothetical protein